MRVEDHARQLRRLTDDTVETNDNSEALGGLRVLGFVMIVLELCTLGFGIFHLLHGDFFISAVAVAIEIGLGVLHYVGMSLEKRLHHNNGARIDRFKDECRAKEDDLLGAAAAYNLRVGRWDQWIRRGYP